MVNDIYKRTGCPAHTIFPLEWMHFKENCDIDTTSSVYRPSLITYSNMTGDWGCHVVYIRRGFEHPYLDWDEHILDLQVWPQSN